MRIARAEVALAVLWVLLFGIRGFGAPAYYIETVAGSDNVGDVGDGGAASDALLFGVEGMALDSAGNLFLADSLDHRVRRVDTLTGKISTVAGTGRPGLAGDGDPACEAMLDSPYDVAADALGNIYIADYGNHRVRRILTDGRIETVAGGGDPTAVTPALAANFEGPRNVAVDDEGNLFIADFDGNRVYRVALSGTLSVVAGTGAAGVDPDGPAASVRLDGPAGLAVSGDGLFIADSGNNRVVFVEDGLLYTVLGGGTTTIEPLGPTGLAVDENRTLLVADSGNRRVLMRLVSGQVDVVTDDVDVRDVAVGEQVYVGGGILVFLIEATATTTIAGGESPDTVHNGVKATSVRLDGPIGVATDSFSRLHIAEEGRQLIRRIDAGEWISTVAGTGKSGSSGTGGLAVNAQLTDPVGVAVDTDGRVWIADYLGQVVRRVELDGTIVTVAGTGTAGFAGDGDLATLSILNLTRAVAVDSQGFAYIADSGNHCVRVIRPDGVIETVAGIGVRGLFGDWGLAKQAALDTPAALAIGPDDSVYIADAGNHTVRKLRPDSFITPVAGNGIAGYDGDGGPAGDASLDSPTGLAIDTDGNLLIADTGNHRIRRVDTDGIITTVAGNGTPGFSGDGAAAFSASLDTPSGLAFSPDGDLYVADVGNNRVRRLFQAQADPATDEPLPCQVLHAATFLSGPVAPGQIVSVFGDGIGPEEPVTGQLNTTGELMSVLGGTEIRIGGVSAPLFFAGDGQVNAQVPVEAGVSGSAVVEVFVGGHLHSQAEVDLASSAPGLFTLENGTGAVVALNEDGTYNSQDRPASRGSVVVMYATGAGLMDPPAATGWPAVAPLPQPVLPIDVRIGGLPAEVLYAGAAPGFVGLVQLNVQIPGGFAPSGDLAVQLFVGGVASQSGAWITVN